MSRLNRCNLLRAHGGVHAPGTLSSTLRFLLSTKCKFLAQIVLDAMRSNDEDVVLQGIEFWTSICEVEIALNDEAKDVRFWKKCM